MINPRIIYILVAMVFVYLVAKFKLVPYLAARKILKDSKRNGITADTPTTTGQTSGDLLGITPANIMQIQALMSSVHPSSVAPVPSAPSRRDMYFDYRIVETVDADGESVSCEDKCKKVDLTVNHFLLDLRNRGICPDNCHIVPVSDGLLMVYATYTL